MKYFLRNYFEDLLAAIGCVCILVGLCQISLVLTWIVGGVMLITFALMIGKAKANVNH